MNNLKNDFKNSYESVINSAGSYESVLESEQYINDVQNEINKVVEEIKRIGNTQKGFHFIKGDIAEPWHAGTANIDAIAKGKDFIKFNVPRDSGPIDIVGNSPIDYLKFQLKYYKTPEETTKAISRPEYFNLIKIVPSDQLEEIKRISLKLYYKNLSERPEQALQYLDTYHRACNRIETHGTEGKPLPDVEALKIVKEIQKGKFNGKNHGLTSDNFIEWSDIFRESGQAAINAAMITAILKTAPHLYKIINNWIHDNNYELSDLEAIGIDIVTGASEGALRGGIAAFLTASCRSGILGEVYKEINPTIVAAATVIAINSFKNSVRLYKGEITQAEFMDICIKDSFVIGIGLVGASIGQALIPIPILGALVGNFIGSIFASLTFDSSKNILFSFFIKSGVSFFGIVEQDYTVPADVLHKMGFDLINLDKIEIDKINIDTIDIDTIDIDTMDIKFLKRGMICVNVVGFI